MSVKKIFSGLYRDIKRVIYNPIVSMHKSSITHYTSIVLIVLLAFIVRVTPMLYYEHLLKAFDPWGQYRIAKYILDNGIFSWFHWRDNMVWYPYGRDMAKTAYPGTPLTGLFFYYLFSYLGFNIDLLTALYLTPAIMGTLSVFVMYFFGKEIGGIKTGLLSAFFLAITPGFLQRTVAGFFDNEAPGLFAMILTYYLFTKALKKGSLPAAIGAGFSLGYLSVTWGASAYAMNLLPLTVLFLILFKRYSSNTFIAYVPTITIGLLIALSTPRKPPTELFTDYGIPALGILLLVFLIEIWRKVDIYVIDYLERIISAIALRIPEKMHYYKYLIVYSVGTAILVGVSLIFYFNLIPSVGTSLIKFFGGKFWGTISPFYREKNQLFSSVGEQLTTPWSMFYYNLHYLLVFFITGVFFHLKRLKNEDIFILLYGITALYFSGSLIRLVLIFATAAALMGAYGIVAIYTPFVKIFKIKPTLAIRRRKQVGQIMSREFVALAFIGLFVLVSFNVWHDVHIDMTVGQPEISPNPQINDWLEALEYMRLYLPDNAVVISWWDYGYWITSVGNKTTAADGGTINSTQIAMIGYAFMAPNETETLRVLRKLGATYVLVFFGLFIPNIGGDENKWVWMVRIASEYFGSLINVSEYYNETSGEIQPLFFNSTIYKLLLYQEPGGAYRQQVQQALFSQNSRYAEWGKHIPQSLQFFEVEHFTVNHLVKLYKINWAAWYKYVQENNISTNWP